MAAEEIETFINEFDDEEFLETCNQLEQRAGTECSLTSLEQRAGTECSLTSLEQRAGTECSLTSLEQRAGTECSLTSLEQRAGTECSLTSLEQRAGTESSLTSLEQRAGTECSLTSLEQQGFRTLDRASSVSGCAPNANDPTHESSVDGASSTARVQYTSVGRDHCVESLPVEAPSQRNTRPYDERRAITESTTTSCGNTLPYDERKAVTESTATSCGNSRPNDERRAVTESTATSCENFRPNDERRAVAENTAASMGNCHEGPEGSSSSAPAAEGHLNTSGTGISSSEDTKPEVDGRRSHEKQPKRRKSKSSDTEEEDVLERYMRRSDQKYAFNKADPNYPPLLTLRHGHLAASDFTALLWCEQQYVYKKTIPARVRREKVPEPEYVAAGTVLHRERELAIQKYVPVKTTSAEDSFSVEYSNTLLFMQRLLRQEKPVVREVRVMGEINGVLICGIIDELRVADIDDFAIDLMEFKTRNSKTVPRKVQKENHDLQVMLYKYIFDDMIRGRCFDDHLAGLGLDIDVPLGEAVAASIQRHCTRHGGAPFSTGETWTVRRLFEELRLVMQALPFIRTCFVSYTFQGDGDTFHENQVAYDEGWLLGKLSHGLSFWRGERGSEGVDVEEAWKCRLCPYQEHCWWVRHKSEQLQRQNQQRHGTAQRGQAGEP